MQSQLNNPPQANSAYDACWRRIGVQGDSSCPRLTEAVHCRNCPVFSAAGQQLFQREAPSQYLEEWTQRIAEVGAVTASEELSVIIFRIGAEWLAFDTHAVVEVVELRPIHRVPHRTDRLLLGLANIRGELLLCVSLRELLGIEETSPHPDHLPTNLRSVPGEGTFGMGSESISSPVAKQRLLVVEQEQTRWVFPVDEVDGVYRTQANTFEDLPHTVDRSVKFYSRAIFAHRNRKVGILSQERIFQALEKTIR
jgi:chemotaxis-related protein WspD